MSLFEKVFKSQKIGMALPADWQTVWDSPDRLYNRIISALQKPTPDVLPAIDRLKQLSLDLQRDTVLRGIYYRTMGQLPEAKSVFRQFIHNHGPDSLILINLAKVYVEEKDEAMASEVLWQALRQDPNHPNALGLWVALNSQDDQGPAYEAALSRVAALPDAWMAHLYLLILYTQTGQVEAKAHMVSWLTGYLGHHSDALLAAVAHLHSEGRWELIVAVAEPVYALNTHDPQVGLALTEAYLQNGQIEMAQVLGESLLRLLQTSQNTDVSALARKLRQLLKKV